MQILIGTCALHQDEGGWWVETATGTLVGPGPELARARTTKSSRFKP